MLDDLLDDGEAFREEHVAGASQSGKSGRRTMHRTVSRRGDWRIAAIPLAARAGPPCNEPVSGVGTSVPMRLSTADSSSLVWPHPLDFRPERWLDTDGHPIEAVPYTFVPIGGGAWRCIGFAKRTGRSAPALGRQPSSHRIQCSRLARRRGCEKADFGANHSRTGERNRKTGGPRSAARRRPAAH